MFRPGTGKLGMFRPASEAKTGIWDARQVLVGDFNIAPGEHDVWSHKQLLKVVSHTPLEVERLAKLQNTHEFIDCARSYLG